MKRDAPNLASSEHTRFFEANKTQSSSLRVGEAKTQRRRIVKVLHKLKGMDFKWCILDLEPH